MRQNKGTGKEGLVLATLGDSKKLKKYLIRVRTFCTSSGCEQRPWLYVGCDVGLPREEIAIVEPQEAKIEQRRSPFATETQIRNRKFKA